MSDQERNGMGSSAARLNCPVCGHLYRAGDRFCAECGAALPQEQQPAPVASSASDPAPESEGSFWVLGATPTTVIGGGILLLILAALLLFVGQVDKTGTIVMLSICVAPIALLVLLVGIVRTVVGTTRRG